MAAVGRLAVGVEPIPMDLQTTPASLILKLY